MRKGRNSKKLIWKYTYEIFFAILCAAGLLFGTILLVNLIDHLFLFLIPYGTIVFLIIDMIFLLFAYSFAKELLFEEKSRKIFRISFLSSSIFFLLIYFLFGVNPAYFINNF